MREEQHETQDTDRDEERLPYRTEIPETGKQEKPDYHSRDRAPPQGSEFCGKTWFVSSLCLNPHSKQQGGNNTLIERIAKHHDKNSLFSKSNGGVRAPSETMTSGHPRILHCFPWSSGIQEYYIIFNKKHKM